MLRKRTYLRNGIYHDEIVNDSDEVVYGPITRYSRKEILVVTVLDKQGERVPGIEVRQLDWPYERTYHLV